MRTDMDTTNVRSNVDESLFQHVMDSFFSIRQDNPYWLMVVMYYRKEKRLVCVENYTGTDLVIAEQTIEMVDENKKSIWEASGTRSLSVIIENMSEEERWLVKTILSNDILCIGNLNSHVSDDAKFLETLKQSINSRKELLFMIAQVIRLMLSDEWFESIGSSVFHMLMARIQDQGGHAKDEFMQPVRVSELVMSLLDAKEGRLYNPYAGVCSYMEYLDKNVDYFGQEISNSAYSAKFNLLMHGRKMLDCLHDDSHAHWRGGDNYDYIVATPPFGVRTTNRHRSLEREFFFKSAFDTHKKAIGVYPLSLCSGHRYPSDLTSDIIDNDWVEYVIQLPQNLFASTKLSTVIIVINKQKSRKGVVRFVDASSFFTVNGRKNELCADRVLEACCSLHTGENVRDVEIEKIAGSNYILSPRFYTISPEVVVPEGMTAVALSTIVRSMERVVHSTPQKGKLFSFGAVNRNNVPRNTVSASELEIREIPGNSIKVVKEDCLLFDRRISGKAVYLHTQGENIFVRPDMLALKLNTDVVDPTYLAEEFSKPYFRRQWARFGNGTIANFCTKEDVLSFKVLLPNVRSEQAKLALENEISAVNAVALKQDEDFKRKLHDFELNQRQRKHAVQQVLGEILPSVELLEGIILSQDTVTKDTIVSRRYGTTFQQYITNVVQQVKKTVDMVDRFTESNVYGEPEEVELKKFFSDYCNSKVNESYRAEFIHLYEEEETEQIVKISRKDLTQILDNLFSNAMKYGFVNHEKKDYAIRIETNAVHDFDKPVVITISNNGEPVSQSIDVEKLFAWGVGQGTGTGCWEVKQIVEHFGGSVSYTEYPDDPNGFVCEFRIELPLYTD